VSLDWNKSLESRIDLVINALPSCVNKSKVAKPF